MRVLITFAHISDKGHSLIKEESEGETKMEEKSGNKPINVRNIIIAAVVGIVVGITMGVLSGFIGFKVPFVATGASVGAAIGITYVLLNNSKGN